MAKRCISCGMPLTKPEHYPQGDDSKDYCCHCARSDGSMLSYNQALDKMADFLEQSQGLESAGARQAARAMMARMPAWRDHIDQ